MNIVVKINAAGATLSLCSWRERRRANARVMRSGSASMSAAYIVSSATLTLNLVASDATTDPTYTVTAHAIVKIGRAPCRERVYTFDDVISLQKKSSTYNNRALSRPDSVPTIEPRETTSTTELTR